MCSTRFGAAVIAAGCLLDRDATVDEDRRPVAVAAAAVFSSEMLTSSVTRGDMSCR
ncbi:MAG TPA: hypothetical protein VK680_03400 [Solirubrobacteraceae bacterium]|nr:hypothetical protein [Solirubrobacteraceae bacterium]